jgi:hypothetical protein
MQTESLKKEAEEIRSFYNTIDSDHASVIEIRAEQWMRLGAKLNEHQKHVEAEGLNWTKWAIEHFRFIGERRRQQAMFLGGIGIEKLKNQLYMGFDRLYLLWSTLFDYHREPDLTEILKTFGFSDKPTPDENEQEILKTAADHVSEFYKFKRNNSQVQYDRDLLIAAIISGCKFSGPDFKKISEIVKQNQPVDGYLLEKLATGSGGSNKSINRGSRESIFLLLAKIIQSIDIYMSTNSVPPFLSKELVGTCHNRLTWLVENCQ